METEGQKILGKANAGRPHATWRSKWRYVCVYWLVQAVAMHLAAAAFASDGSITSARGFAAALTDSDMFMVSGVVAGIVTLLQAELLLPIRRPLERGLAPHARFLHCMVAGLAIAVLSWLAMWPPMYLLEDVLHQGAWLTSFLNKGAGLTVPLAVFGITLVLMWHYGRNGVPAVVSALISAAGAAAFLGGLSAILWSIPRLLEGSGSQAQPNSNPFEKATVASVSASALIGWAVGTPLVLSFMRRRGNETALARLSACLFLGTTVEAAAAIPLDVMIRKKTDCYCGESTFWTLSLCWAAGSLSLGPVIFLVPFGRRRKRWYAGLCDACGYDMSGCMNAERCPECGAGWKPSSDQSADV